MVPQNTNEKSPLQRGSDSEEICLLLKCEDPSSGPQHPEKQQKPASWLMPVNLRTVGGRVAEAGIPGAHQLANLAKCRSFGLNERPPTQKTGMGVVFGFVIGTRKVWVLLPFPPGKEFYR